MLVTIVKVGLIILEWRLMTAFTNPMGLENLVIWVLLCLSSSGGSASFGEQPNVGRPLQVEDTLPTSRW